MKRWIQSYDSVSSNLWKMIFPLHILFLFFHVLYMCNTIFIFILFYYCVTDSWTTGFLNMVLFLLWFSCFLVYIFVQCVSCINCVTIKESESLKKGLSKINRWNSYMSSTLALTLTLEIEKWILLVKHSNSVTASLVATIKLISESSLFIIWSSVEFQEQDKGKVCILTVKLWKTLFGDQNYWDRVQWTRSLFAFEMIALKIYDYSPLVAIFKRTLLHDGGNKVAIKKRGRVWGQPICDN